MRLLIRYLNRLLDDRRGATAVEYGLILALIFLALVTGARVVGTTTGDMWNNVSTKIDSVVS
ncbi:pilus assembly protein Flp/PilA [Sphingomonas guangdongensis]|uniref:Pilus assembly protein Flp/PilA n=1 Tax=Sphingomonas guangdongensis TaxID=1141890 RepID=A0A285QY23_9SPHN|nr:Flp family type IVb pilin [Sphingomonas guangdongensis]SOB86813.1 pilus assembly protein Flp/PilA [Sphingomonas guangdongensis]